MEQALTGIKVLDLSHYIAGPYCTKLLADYGAEVIKVERPGVGDGARRLGPFYRDDPHMEKSGLFLHLNTNKKGITLDLEVGSGIKIFKELVREVEILVENFEPRVMGELGLSYEVLEKINPRLVMTSISNFGQSGPYRDYKATEIVSFAMSPHMYSEGEPDREPLKFPGYKAQYLAGTYGVVATMGAFLGSQVSGVGQHVDVSIMECLSSLPEGATVLINYAFSGEGAVIRRTGYRREGVYPWAVYPCQDGYIFIFAMLPMMWPRVARWLGMPALVDDPRFAFADPKARGEHHSDFDAILLPWLLERTRVEVVKSAQAERIPLTPVYTIDDVLEDAQFNARGFFTEVEHPVVGRVTYPGLPFKLPEVPTVPHQPAPLLGQHNQEIYGGWLGYNQDDLVRLRERGII